MSDKFQNKYRIQSSRLRNWDYRSNAAYFVTICTCHWECFFGTIENDEMVLSEIGIHANQCWMDIPNHFSFVSLGEFVVMPNHVHGIIIINKYDKKSSDSNIHYGNAIPTDSGIQNAKLSPISVDSQDAIVETPNLGVSTTASLHRDAYSDKTAPPICKRRQTLNASQKWNPGSLGVIINLYKRAITVRARHSAILFSWQTRYHDHIIRNDNEFNRISNYIRNNPRNWRDDKFFG